MYFSWFCVCEECKIATKENKSFAKLCSCWHYVVLGISFTYYFAEKKTKEIFKFVTKKIFENRRKQKFRNFEKKIRKLKKKLWERVAIF